MDDKPKDPKLPPFAIRHREGRTPIEQEFLKDVERIAAEVASMSDEEVEAYLKEHELEDLVTPERIDALLASVYGDPKKAAAKLVIVWDRDKQDPET